MARVAFADESGIDGSTKCYAIGVVSVAASRIGHFNQVFESLKRKHGVDNEVRWTSVRNSHGLVNLGIDWLHRIVTSSTARFDAIVVNTALYRKWRDSAGREEAFYRTYTFLLRHLALRVREETTVMIDDRSDEYPKRHEVVETITNRMLAQLHATGRLKDVIKVRSHDHPGIQIADMLTGAVASSHRLFLDPAAPINAAKRLAIQRMASLIGWDALHYDTFPHDKFNIWHFPLECRGTPASRKINVARLAPFITPAELGTSHKRARGSR